MVLNKSPFDDGDDDGSDGLHDSVSVASQSSTTITTSSITFSNVSDGIINDEGFPPFRVGDQIYQNVFLLVRRYGIVMDIQKAKDSCNTSYLLTIASAMSGWKGWKGEDARELDNNESNNGQKKLFRKYQLRIRRDDDEKKNRLHVVSYLGDPLRVDNGWEYDVTLTKFASGPIDLVLERVQFLLRIGESMQSSLQYDDIPYKFRIVFEDSECPAVWCKTGTWSKLNPVGTPQVAGGAAGGAAAIGAVPVTTAAEGIMGFFGATEVLPLAIAAPEVIPFLAIAAGVPVGVTVCAKMFWKKATEYFNEQFESFRSFQQW